MKTRLMTFIAASLIAGSMLASPAFAQIANDPGHPRVNEVDQRLNNQQNRVDNGVKDGQMTPGQAGRDEKRDARIEQQAGRDEAKHGGHLTKGEQHHLNRELNHNSHDIHRQRHHEPRHGGGRHWHKQ